jgi:Na+/melibiose symporter-like transporter
VENSGLGRGGLKALFGEGTWVSRLVWLIFFAGPLAVVITAAFLTPSSEGHGTHTQLGLPPCGFLVYTGVPCPGCGLTTSFSHMVRLEVFGAAHANLFGILLFLTTVAMIPVAAIGFVKKTPVIDTLDLLHAEKIAVVLSIVSIAVWLFRVGAHFLG